MITLILLHTSNDFLDESRRSLPCCLNFLKKSLIAVAVSINPRSVGAKLMVREEYVSEDVILVLSKSMDTGVEPLTLLPIFCL